MLRQYIVLKVVWRPRSRSDHLSAPSWSAWYPYRCLRDLVKKGAKRLAGSGGGVSADNGSAAFSYGIRSHTGVEAAAGIYRDVDEGEGQSSSASLPKRLLLER